MTNKDITIIIPVHMWDENVEHLLNEAMKSIPVNCSVIISTTKDSGVSISEEIKDSFNDFAIIVNENSSFQSLVNHGVNNVITEWFSILEFDDEYNPIWFPNFIKYQEYNQKYNIFLPINDLYNVEGGKDEFVGNGNEAPWASSFSDEMGVIDEKCLDDYFDFYLCGAIIRTTTWKNLGGLKESIKLTFWYEFLLRAAHNGENMYVIPKVGYAHVLGREGSLMMKYRKEMDVKESDFWFKTAKKESFMHPDIERDINYNPENQE